MKPYLYILAVLLVGGTVGFYVGREGSGNSRSSSPNATSVNDQVADRQAIEQILQRQRDSYRLHDALLLLQDCSSVYVEINTVTGECMNLQKALLHYHKNFIAGKSITVSFKKQEINMNRNGALVKADYLKTSDQYEQEGFRGILGEGLWLLAKTDGKWEIVAFSWTEEPKL